MDGWMFFSSYDRNSLPPFQACLYEALAGEWKADRCDAACFVRILRTGAAFQYEDGLDEGCYKCLWTNSVMELKGVVTMCTTVAFGNVGVVGVDDYSKAFDATMAELAVERAAEDGEFLLPSPPLFP